MKKLSFFLLILGALPLLVNCSSTGGTTSASINPQQLGKKVFGNDDFKTHQILYSTGFSSAVLGGSAEELALVNLILPAQQQCVDLLVWGRSSALTAGVIARAFERYLPILLKSNLSKLRLLFIGKSEDAQNLKSKVEATGAVFLFQQLP
jgi:hypothetical protein